MPPLRANGSPHKLPRASNQAVRLRILRRVSVQAAIALRVACVRALRSPWPLLARRYYLARAAAKLAYLLPLTVGTQVSGLRVVNIQSRWALAAITGRTTWPHTLKVPSSIRKQLCADLGWPCLWTSAKVAAVTLYEKCSNDSSTFAHARLSADPGSFAPGGWLSAVHRLCSTLKIPRWVPAPDECPTARKRSLARHRKSIVQPRIAAALDSTAADPPLPWAWIALNADITFPASAFSLWWQLRALGKAYPSKTCPWCVPAVTLARTHLQQRCPRFAETCWTTGIRPEEAFMYPFDAAWLSACLIAVRSVDAAWPSDSA